MRGAMRRLRYSVIDPSLMQIRILSGADVRAAIDMPVAIEAMRQAFATLSEGGATVPVRLPLESEHGVTPVSYTHLTLPTN